MEMLNFPQLISIQSSAITKDVDCINNLFPRKYTVERCKDSETVILVDTNIGHTIIISFSPDSWIKKFNKHASPNVWMMEESEILGAVKRNDESFSTFMAIRKESSFLCADISLPGGSIFLALSPTIMDYTEGRQVLASMVVPNYLSSNNTDAGGVERQPENGKDSIDPILKPQDMSKLFPSLEVSSLKQDGTFQPNFHINSKTAVPIETDLFVGKALLILRPTDPEDDPYWNERIFSKKKRKTILQVQGKFKQKPKGIVYAGAEVSEPMKLGLIAKGMSTILLNVVKKFFNTVHYSFGSEEENAHIVVPAYNIFERFVVTPPEEEPPILGEPLNETKESIAARRNAAAHPDWNTVDTYSMSFYSMYIDISSWGIVGLPVASYIDLHKFWGNASLRMVMYESTAPEKEKRHLLKENNNAVILQLKHLEHGSNSSENDRQPSNSEDSASLLTKGIPQLKHMHSFSDRDIQRNDSQIFQPLDDDEQSQFFFDAAEYDEDFVSATFDSINYPLDSSSRSQGSAIDSLMQEEEQLPIQIDKLCPAWIDVCESRGRYQRVYCFNVEQGTQTLLRTSNFCKQLLGWYKNGNKSIKCNSARTSDAERTRRLLGLVLGNAIQNFEKNDKLQKFKTSLTEYDRLFLHRRIPTFATKLKSQSKMSGFAARALSDHHWIEEWIDLSTKYISFYHPDKRKPRHRVGLSTIIRIKILDSIEKPCFVQHHFLALECLGRTIYLMFPSETEQDKWSKAIEKVIQKPRSPNHHQSLSSDLSPFHDETLRNGLIHVDNPTDAFLHKSSMWDCKSRRVLNCQHFSFETNNTVCQQSALSLVEDALYKALDPTSKETEIGLLTFLESASKLKEVNVHGLPEEVRLTFFLNLYHLMVMHAYLVLGFPESPLHWISYFNCIAYHCCDDIISLAEVEHCIIRAKMGRPSQFISRFVIPKSKYAFALTQPDLRINFALNCGSYSNPKSIPIFNVQKLEDQLDTVSRLYLEECTASVRKRHGSHDFIVTLPSICQWYSDDFGNNTETIVNAVEPYLTKKQQLLLKTGTENVILSLNYLPYSFKCRELTLLLENE